MPGAGAAPVAWLPQGEDELAVSDRRGRVKTVSAVTGRILWTSSAGERPTTLSWSRDGRRLAAVGPRLARVLDRRGRTIARLRPHRRARFAGGAYSPRSAVLALVEHRAGGSAVYQSSDPRDRTMYASAAPQTDLTCSPDGRWLLVGSPAADQWLFLRGRLPHRVVAISDVAGQFDPAGSGVAIPRVAGWCCGR